MRSKHGGDGGTGVYMWEGTTSRVTAADRPYGEFYGFYSVSPEHFGSTHVLELAVLNIRIPTTTKREREKKASLTEQCQLQPQSSSHNSYAIY